MQTKTFTFKGITNYHMQKFLFDHILTMVISCTTKPLIICLKKDLQLFSALTGAIRGTSREKVYQKVGLESL